MDFDARGIALGFAAAALVLAALVWLVGVDDLVAAAARLELRYVAAIVAFALCWIACWAQSLRAVLLTLDVSISRTRAVVLYAAAVFANNITPFGQAGGEPFSALLISRATDSEYENGLAAIATIDAANFVPSVVLALAGLGYYVFKFTVGDRLLNVIVAVVAFAVAVPTAGYLLWRSKEELVPRVARVVAAVGGVVSRLVPPMAPPDAEAIRGRLESFVEKVGRIGRDRGTLVRVLGFSTLGWLCMMSSFWLTLRGLGYPVAPWVAIVAVPVSGLAGATPLPGGLGSVESALVLFIVPITGVPAAAATTAALVYRGATYWVPTAVGGVAVAWLQGPSLAGKTVDDER